MSNQKSRRVKFRQARRLAASAVALFVSLSTHAACQITGVTDLGFGAYDVFSRLPNNNAVGTIVIRCTGSSSATVKLSAGFANSFAPRRLRSGSNVLAYNLYTSAARNIVWGDGTGGTSVMSIGKNRTASLDVFGSVPEGQDVPVGNYADSVVVTVTF
jgi:spore coat protein U-like protein